MVQKDTGLVSRRSTLKGIAGTSIVALAGCSNDDGGNGGGNGGTTTLTVGSSTEGSTSFAEAQGLQAAVRDTSDSVRLSTQTTQGNEANLRLIDNGEVDAAFITNFGWQTAIAEEGPYADRPISTFPYQGWIMMDLHEYWVTPTSSDIETTDDLVGSSIFLNPQGTGVRATVEPVVRNAGIYENADVMEISRDDVPGAFQQGRLDAAVVYGVNYQSLSGWVQQIDARNDVQLVETTDSYVQAIEDTAGVPARGIDVYGWEQDLGGTSTTASSLVSQFCFHPSVSVEVAKELTRIGYEEKDQIIETTPQYPNFENIEEMTNNVMPDEPVHPGTAEYWKENDAWDDSWSEGEV